MVMSNNLINSLGDIEFNYRDKLNIDKHYKFGIEIEFEKASFYDVEQNLFENRHLKNWDLHNEPTVSADDDFSLGGEIVSPILRNTKRTWNNIKIACNMLKELDAEALDKTGAHIHIDQSILKDDKTFILNLLKLWTIYEHVIYYFSYGRQSKGRAFICSYAYRMAVIFNIFIKCHKYDRDENLYSNIMDFCDDFHSSLKGGLWFADCKGVSGFKNSTIEIRCPNGTLDEKIWQNNINFFINLLSKCASNELDLDFINYKFEKYQDIYNYNGIYLNDALELSNIIFDDDTDKVYFLKQYVKKI